VGKVLMIGTFEALLKELHDDPVIRDHQIECCEDSLTALRQARDDVVDVVITDPASSISADLALASELRAWRPDVKVVALTRYMGPEDVIAALRAHVFACFATPFDTSEIAHMVWAAVRARDWRDGIQVVSGIRNWLTLKVSPRLLTAERVVRFMAEMQSGVPDDERDQLILAFREMLLNAMEHGAGFDEEKTIEVTAARTGRAIVYHLRDPGAGFDRDSLAHAAPSADPAAIMSMALLRAERGMRPGGLGTLIAREIADEISYNERGNEVILIKYLTDAMDREPRRTY
jgi:anti-sigma regulatory factor (Ser/Thr protein kinase)/ActR/RegA family two-component response regulator